MFLSNRNFQKLYNVPCVLRAFAVIQARIPTRGCIVIGDGPERARVHETARSLALRNVEFVGAVSPTEMGRWYDEADVYLNSSDIDNMPNSIIEAFACGLPVVTTRPGGIPYVVEHERNGLLVDCDDHEALAASALRLFDEPALAERLITEGLRDVQEQLHVGGGQRRVGGALSQPRERPGRHRADGASGSGCEPGRRWPLPRSEHAMRRGVRVSDDPAERRRTVTTLPAELRVRGAQVLSSFREQVGLALGNGEDATAGTPRQVTRELRGDPARIAATARARLAQGVLPGLRDVRTTVSLLRRARPEAETGTRCRADRAVDGVFDLLGHERVAVGTPIDWHRDPSTGTRAPRRHWSRIAYLDPAVVGDYKLLWELNRHQHFVTLGQAYAYSRDSRYARAFASQLAGWISANPPRIGVNWASSLEVSYRAISWLWALQLFADAPELTDELLLTALESLRRHAVHIERYLSTYYSPNTHLTGEALGLLYLGTALPLFSAADRWRETGWAILREQLFRQVRPDGSYFEQALYYHRYTADIFHHALLLAEANGWTPEPVIRERVDAARRVSRARACIRTARCRSWATTTGDV